MYNKLQIDKNLMLFESSLNEVFAKYSIEPSGILYQRIETTIELAGIVKDSIQKFKGDEYIDGVISRIDNYNARFGEMKTATLKSRSELQHA